MKHRGLAGLCALSTAALLVFAGCQGGSDAGHPKGLLVYATTGYLADAVANIAPESKIVTMVGPGGDPHTYQPSTKDIEAMQAADAVFWNGLHLEAQMIDQLESLGDKQLAVGDTLPKELLLDWAETDEQGNPLHDPHIWNDPNVWSQAVGLVGDKLAKSDPGRADEYRTNTAAYQAKIAETAAEADKLLTTISDPRILITGHDAFNYLGAAYRLEVHATDFVSSEAALSPAELSELAHLIADNKVPVIFQDNLANPQAITSLKEAVHALGWQVEISNEQLYADSLGSEPEVDSYLEVFLHNAQAISRALSR